jgi:hypothetical protein
LGGLGNDARAAQPKPVKHVAHIHAGSRRDTSLSYGGVSGSQDLLVVEIVSPANLPAKLYG